jgi:hypothetical protein
VWLVVTDGAVVEDSVVVVVGGTAEAQALRKPIDAATTVAKATFFGTFISDYLIGTLFGSRETKLNGKKSTPPSWPGTPFPAPIASAGIQSFSKHGGFLHV